MKNLLPNEVAPYYAAYIDLVPDQNIVKGLKKQKEELLHFFKAIPVFKHEFAYAADKWTIKDVLLHLIDTERIFAYRTLRIARNDKTELPGFDENNYARAAKANDREYESLLQEYSSVREATINLFENFDASTLLNMGTASNNSFSVRSFKCDNFFNRSAYSPSSLSYNELASI